MPRSSSQKSSSLSFPKPPPPAFRNPYSSVGHPTPSATAPSFGQSMKDGFGLGVGSAIAQRVIGGLLGAPTVNVVNKTDQTQTQTQTKASPCEKEHIAFESCIKTHSVDTFCGQEQIELVNCIQVSGPISRSHQ